MPIRKPPVYRKIDVTPHKDYESRDTRVSEYLRKYGTGKIDEMPNDTRAEIKDNRSVDEQLADGFEPSLGTDDLDVLMELDKAREHYEAALADIELTKQQKADFDKAIKVLKDSNSSIEMKEDAYRILRDLESKGKVTRARV